MGRKSIRGMVVVMALAFLSFVRLTEGVAGGEPAKPGEFPHAVQLSSVQTQKLFCGGSIIAPNVVLTAAHCLLEDYLDIFGDIRIRKMSPGSILVTAGKVEKLEWNPFQKKEGQTIAVTRYIEHPKYSPAPLENDIALLILEKPLIYNDKVQPVQLPPPNVIFPRGTVAGWGYTDGRNMTSAYLKKLELDFEDRETCNWNPLMEIKPKNLTVSNLELCAIFERGSGTCEADSGSSVTCRRSATAVTPKNKIRSLRPTICGIVSWGKTRGPCGESQDISVFLDVSQYLDWIQDTMEAEGFGNLTKQLSCSESEGFFDCGELGLDGKKIKPRCILIEKKCDGVNNCENGWDENDVFCAAKNTSDMESDIEASSTPKLEEPVETKEEGAQIETGSTSEPGQDKKLEEENENNDLEASSTPKLEPVEVTDEETQITEVPDKEEKVCVWFSLFVSFATLILIGILITVFYWLWNRSRSPIPGPKADLDEV